MASLKVMIDGSEAFECDEEMSFYEISKNFKKNFKYDILGVKVDNDFADLSDTLK